MLSTYEDLYEIKRILEETSEDKKEHTILAEKIDTMADLTPPQSAKSSQETDESSQEAAESSQVTAESSQRTAESSQETAESSQETAESSQEALEAAGQTSSSCCISPGKQKSEACPAKKRKINNEPPPDVKTTITSKYDVRPGNSHHHLYLSKDTRLSGYSQDVDHISGFFGNIMNYKILPEET